MTSVTEHLNKLREDRIAREKARIEKLRELNLKKYNTPQLTQRAGSSLSITKVDAKKTNLPNISKNNIHVNGMRPITVPMINQQKNFINKNLTVNNNKISKSNDTKIDKTNTEKKKFYINKVSNVNKGFENAKTSDKTTSETSNTVDIGPTETKNSIKIDNNLPRKVKTDINITKNMTDGLKVDQKSSRKSFLPRFEPDKALNAKPKPLESARRSIQPPRVTQSVSKVNTNRQSVFERLYQPKYVQKKEISDTEKLQKDPNFLKKVLKNTGVILNKRRTVFETKKSEPPVRRSISAVHFKRISKSELGNCVHKWASIGDKLDKVHLKDIDEDATVKEDKIVSAIKSERKKVKFQTPIPSNFNTPKTEELQSRLQKWLQKRGKSIDSYHHLQCFGIHFAQKEIKPVNLETAKFDEFDDEDKENQPVESDSDNDSYKDNMNNKNDNVITDNKWRRASNVSDSVDFNETTDSTLTSTDVHHVDELLIGALNDLTELLREGYSWEQAARWLRCVRERFPAAAHSAPYWECRAALEERRGDLPASLHCWQEAIATGTQRSVVEANLDQLLDKFMQLKISPNSGKKKMPDPKMVDVKNVFKSTLIRFAVQQAKLRQSQDPVKYTVTPVRRSGRLSNHYSAKRTPLQVCTSVRQAELLVHPLEFVPNDKLCETP